MTTKSRLLAIVSSLPLFLVLPSCQTVPRGPEVPAEAPAVRKEGVPDSPKKSVFSGRPQVEFDEQGRSMTLLSNFSFWDDKGVQWTTPKGYQADGSSIPTSLWSITGQSPFTGRHRDPSIVHDYYCDNRVRPWKQTHRMYYEGCLARRMSPAGAKMFYAAVYLGGPRWPNPLVRRGMLAPAAVSSTPIYDQTAADALINRAATLDLTQIEKEADALISGMSAPVPAAPAPVPAQAPAR